MPGMCLASDPVWSCQGSEAKISGSVQCFKLPVVSASQHLGRAVVEGDLMGAQMPTLSNKAAIEAETPELSSAMAGSRRWLRQLLLAGKHRETTKFPSPIFKFG